MNLIDGLLQEFQHESRNTRKLLDRLPEDQFGWQPHPKSMTLGRLASHLAEIPAWTRGTLQSDELNFDTTPYTPFAGKDRAEILACFDKNVADAVECMPGVTNETLIGNWRMIYGGKIVFEMPRIAVLRSMVLSHTIHHRGQLEVYLRIHNVPLPSIYGPSADEAM